MRLTGMSLRGGMGPAGRRKLSAEMPHPREAASTPLGEVFKLKKRMGGSPAPLPKMVDENAEPAPGSNERRRRWQGLGVAEEQTPAIPNNPQLAGRRRLGRRLQPATSSRKTGHPAITKRGSHREFPATMPNRTHG